MSDHFKILLTAALLVWSLPAVAQDTPTDPAPVEEPATDDPVTADPAADPATDPAADPAADPDAGVDGDLAMGEPVDPAAPAVGQPYIRQEFGDWSLRCLRAEEGQAEPCELYQLLNGPDGNPIAEISIFLLPEGSQAAAGATIVAPLETLLTEQLTLSVDGTAARRYPFAFCNRAGCLARVGFTAAEVEQLKRGNVAQLRLVPAVAPDQEMLLDISLSGFTAGMEYDGAAPQQ